MSELCPKCNREMKFLSETLNFVCPSCDAVLLSLLSSPPPVQHSPIINGAMPNIKTANATAAAPISTAPPTSSERYVYIFRDDAMGKSARTKWREADYQFAVRSLTAQGNRAHAVTIAEEYDGRFPGNYRAKQTLALAISDFLTRSTPDMLLNRDTEKFISYAETAAMLAPADEKNRFASAIRDYLSEIDKTNDTVRIITELYTREQELIRALPKSPIPPSEEAVKAAREGYEAIRRSHNEAEAALQAAINDDSAEKLAAAPLPKVIFGKRKAMARRAAEISVAQSVKQLRIARAESKKKLLADQMLAARKKLEECEAEYTKQKQAYNEASANFNSVMYKYHSDVTAFQNDAEEAKALPYYSEITAIFFQLINQPSEN